MLKNKFGTLLLSFVTPMILLGDEVGWTKKGNNNTWCQKELNTFPWHLVPNSGMRRFVRLFLAFRERYELGGREKDGYRIDRHIVKHDTTPLKSDGYGHYTSFIAGEILPFDGDVNGAHVYFGLNAWRDAIEVTLPAPPQGQSWYRCVDSSCPEGEEIVENDDQMVKLGSLKYWVQRHSMIVLVSK
jgi:pullulanase/glycogen debranching enzyme